MLIQWRIVLNQLGYHSCSFKGEKQPSCFCSGMHTIFTFQKKQPYVLQCIHKNMRVVFEQLW